MARRFAICLAMISLLFIAPQPAAAAFSHVFDTVDAVEYGNSGSSLIVTGMLAGQTTPTTQAFNFITGGNLFSQCERLALFALSKPGKYQLHITGSYTGPTPGCKLVRRVP